MGSVIKKLRKRSLTRHIGIVTVTSPLTIVISGHPEQIQVNKLDGYSPTFGDRVWVSRSGNDLVVHDKIT